MMNYTVVRHQQLCQQESGDMTAKNTLVCVIYLWFLWCCGFIRQGAFHGETIISSAGIDNNQQFKVSISN